MNMFMHRKRRPAVAGSVGLALLICGQAAQAQVLVPGFVQTAANANGSRDIPSCNATFPATNAAGNLIIVAVTLGATVDQRQPVVSDSQGNTYYIAIGQTNIATVGNGASCQLFYAPNIKGGSNTVTMSELGGSGGAGNPYNQIAICEYSGVLLPSPLDVAAAAVGTTTSSPFTLSSGSSTASSNGELIFGFANDYYGILSVGGGFTVRQTTSGLSEDMVQATAGPVAATAMDSANSDYYGMFMATFKPAAGMTMGPVLPGQGNRSITPLTPLVVTNTGAEMDTNPVTTSSIVFNYANRAALVADGWSFMATNHGVGRNTENTNSGSAGVISYDQTAHPGVLRIPCDEGDLYGAANNTTNSLFRNVSSNWVSMRLKLSFAPTLDTQEAQLALYQDDDNYVEIGIAYVTGFGGPAFMMISENGGSAVYSYVYRGWMTGDTTVTNMYLRMDRSPTTGNLTAFASFNGTGDWMQVGTFSQSLTNPRLGIWVGGSPVPYTNGLPSCDLEQLDILTRNPGPVLSYQLMNPPGGCQIGTNSGIISWTPSQGQSPSTNTLTTVVSDNRVPAWKATNSFVVVVSPGTTSTNTAPVLGVIGPQTVNELTLLLVTNSASDADIPAQTLTYSLVNPPAGAGIDTNGVITWMPSQTQSPSTNLITTVVTDSGTPPLSATNSFTVTVNEVNSAPVLPVQNPRTMTGQATLVVTNTAYEPNIHSITLGYGLVNPPSGSVINTNGVITWTPSLAQIPSTNLFTTIVTNSNPYDAVNPHLSATNSFTVVVNPTNPVVAAGNIGLVQSAVHNNGAISQSTCTASFPSNNAAGDLIIVAVAIGATADVYQPTIADTQGNTSLSSHQPD